METYTHFWSYLIHFFLEYKIFPTNTVKKIKTRFIFNNIPCPPPPRKSRLFLHNAEKHGRGRQATGDNMACAHCMLGN